MIKYRKPPVLKQMMEHFLEYLSTTQHCAFSKRENVCMCVGVCTCLSVCGFHAAYTS